MTLEAVIFDCDGVLADTERDGHLPAFNEAFAEFGIPVAWTVEEYEELVKIGGGKERMNHALTDADLRAAGLDPADREQIIADLHRTKSAAFQRLVNDGEVPPRPGVRRLNLPDTRLIICSMEGPTMFPDIDRLLAEDEFADMTDRIVVTAEPGYLARFASTNQVTSYQRRFMAAAAGHL